MTYTLFFIPDYQFQKVFYVSLDNNFLLFFCGDPLVVDAAGQLPRLPPPFNPALPEPVNSRSLGVVLSSFLWWFCHCLVGLVSIPGPASNYQRQQQRQRVLAFSKPGIG